MIDQERIEQALQTFHQLSDPDGRVPCPGSGQWGMNVFCQHCGHWIDGSRASSEGRGFDLREHRAVPSELVVHAGLE